MRFGNAGSQREGGWVFGVLLGGAAAIHVGRLLLAGEYGTVLGYAVLAVLIIAMVLALSVLFNGDAL